MQHDKKPRQTELAQKALAAKAARLQEVERLAYDVDEAARAAGVGRSTIYIAIAEGELETLKIGKRRLVPVDALKRWLASKSATAA